MLDEADCIVPQRDDTGVDAGIRCRVWEIVKFVLIVTEIAVQITDTSNKEDAMNEDIDFINLVIENLSDSHILIFTDGSVYRGQVGFGACSAALFPPKPDKEDLQITKRAVGAKVSSYGCKIIRNARCHAISHQ